MSIWQEDCNHDDDHDDDDDDYEVDSYGDYDDDDNVYDNDGDDDDNEDGNQDYIDDYNEDHKDGLDDNGAFIHCKNYLEDARGNIGAGTIRRDDHICWEGSVKSFACTAVLVGIEFSLSFIAFMSICHP